MINEKEFEDFVFIQTLENAVNFGGKANSKATFGKTISKFPEIKTDMNYYKNKIDIITQQINSMSPKEQENKLQKLNPDFFNKTKEKKEKKDMTQLPDLPNHKGKFIGRFAPAPSGYLHIGHLYNLVFNYEYKKKYGGKFIIRFEDTNPEKINIKNYNQILEDIKWITNGEIDEIYYQSDRLEIYYKYLRQLVETGHAYVCECEPEVFKTFNDSSEACPHRERDTERQTFCYEKFFRGKYKEGDACIRFKGDLKNKNPALRDFPIARVNNTEHARVGTKYSLWPMYNFCAAVDDALMGINYIIRGKDSEINGIRQDNVKDALGLPKCPYYHFGRVKFTDVELGKTPLKEKIEKGIYSGWDDPRIPTLVSFRRRGFEAKAFRDMIIAMGMSKRDSKIEEKEYFKSINFFNRQILEKTSNRYAFVMNPKEINITNIDEFPDKEILLPRHPDFKERGFRKIAVKNKYYIDGIDFKNIKKNEIIRLMHFANFKVVKKTKESLELMYISKEYNKTLNITRNIQFVPFSPEEHRKVEIVMQNAQKVKGISEKLENPKIGTPIQFERFGFVRYDSLKEDGIRLFYFTHR